MWSDVENALANFLADARYPLVVIVGPTASGKTDLSLQIALRFGCEIVNADSRQCYRGMDIGTGKIRPADMQGIPHHLLDVLEPSEKATIAWYQKEARAAIDDIRARGRVPLIVGGSMLYVSALVDGLQPLPSDPALRARLERETSSVLHERLRVADPQAAAAIHPHNRVYLIRAMEIAQLGGRKSTVKTGDDLFLIGLRVPREILRTRVESRVRSMFEAGWVAEVRRLLASGVTIHDPGMESVGYREIAEAQDPASVIPQIVDRTMRYAKRQVTWWKHDPRTHWINADFLRI